MLVAGAAAVMIAVLAISHGVTRPSHSSQTAVCQGNSAYEPNQPIIVAEVDATASTFNAGLRAEYAQALDAIVGDAVDAGAYFVLQTFGADPSKTRTVCTASMKIEGAAPLLITARTAAVRRSLEKIARQASKANAGTRGSAIFGALAAAIEQVNVLRLSLDTPATIVLISDGDEAAEGTHLRLLLQSGQDDATIADRVLGTLPPPDARGITTIVMEGVGHLGQGQPLSTTEARRFVRVWERVCARMHPEQCRVSALINTTRRETS